VQIDHINVGAPAALLQQEENFFCEIPELSDGPRPAFTSTGCRLYADDRPIVHLSQGRLALPETGACHLDHVVFRSSGFQALLHRLQNAAIEYSTSYLPELRMTQMFLKAPTATGIEVNFIDETT